MPPSTCQQEFLDAFKDWKIYPEKVASALRNGLDVNRRIIEYDFQDKGSPPLSIATQRVLDGWLHNSEDKGYREEALRILKSLLDAGADVDTKNDHGATPLRVAVYESRNSRLASDVVALLLERHADPTVTDDEGRTPWELALHHRDDPDYAATIRILCAYTKEGRTWSKSAAADEWNREHQVDENSPLGVTPAEAWKQFQTVMGSTGSRNREEVKAWVTSGGDVNWTCSAGMTLLHYACMVGNVDMARFLIEQGADVNKKALKGGGERTPLLWACANIQSALVPVLLQAGADPNAKDAGGLTPLQLINSSGLEEAQRAAKMLEKAGAALIPGKTSICPECGAPRSSEMEKRGVIVRIDQMCAKYSCPSCRADVEVDVNLIDREKGILVLCSSCTSISFLPASVWCNTCGVGLSMNWQESVARESGGNSKTAAVVRAASAPGKRWWQFWK